METTVIDQALVTPPPSGTRAALIAAGLNLFGHRGFEATSTRQLAVQAGTNVASIAYHFRGKDGLRVACAAEVVRQFHLAVGSSEATPPTSQQAARLRIEEMARAFILFLTGSHAADDLTAFLLREITQNSPVIDQIYTAMMEPKHRELCALWGIATGQPPESAVVRLSVFAFLGQMLYFRIGHQIVERRMGWTIGTSPNAAAIADVVIGNLRVLLTERAST
ncbi:MAG: CerR family C-terminal domain-containing protein [Paracoccaceae bacterium]